METTDYQNCVTGHVICGDRSTCRRNSGNPRQPPQISFFRLLTVIHNGVIFHLYRCVIQSQRVARLNWVGGLNMRSLAVAAALMALGASGTARAAPVVLFDGIETADIGAGAPLGIDTSLGNENGGLGGGLLSGDIVFAARAGEITITVTDLGTTASIPPRAGSVYQVLLDTNSLGVTSHTGIDATIFSTGTFSLMVTAGFHDLGVWDFISTFLGSSSPYGGPNMGFVDGDFAQANVSVLVTEAPEPASWVLMGIGLVSLAMIAHRRKRTQTAT